MKALAAATARPSSAVPSHVRGAELSGMVGRRDSVVGARIDDRAPISAGLSWVWVAAGCVAVLAPGFVGVWLIGRASSPSATTVAVMRPAMAAPLVREPPAVEIEPLAHLQALVPENNDPPRPAVRPPFQGGRRFYRHRSAEARRAALAAAMVSAPDTGRAAGAGAGAITALAAGAANPFSAPVAEPAAAADDDDKPVAAKAPEEQQPEKPRKVVEAAPEEPANGPPRTVKELRSALARLQTRVFQCHQRFQVDGVADVHVAVNPTGTVESASLAGEFEGTPTGDCIVRLVSAASFPTFDGTESIRVSHSFSLE